MVAENKNKGNWREREMNNHKTITTVAKDRESMALISSMILCVIAIACVAVTFWYL
jgi:hypothetical protein